MSLKEVTFKPIGIIHSEHALEEKTPVQSVFAGNSRGLAEVFPEYADGLADIENFSHVYLIYHLHKVNGAKLKVNPFLQDKEHGIFATRAPWRPNAIGLSIVELVKREGNILHLKGVDILDGTPILDIKPYSARFDHIQAERSGWMDEVDDATANERGKREYAS